jgi:hypothetical protein
VERIEEMAAELGLLSETHPASIGLNVVVGASTDLGRCVISSLANESKLVRGVVVEKNATGLGDLPKDKAQELINLMEKEEAEEEDDKGTPANRACFPLTIGPESLNDICQE